MDPSVNAPTPPGETKNRRRLLGFFLFPLALFPLLALVSYSWKAIPALAVPPAQSANLIGVLGDAFAYRGYMLVGLGLWAVPPLVLLLGLLFTLGRDISVGKRTVAFFVFLFSATCLLQLLGGTPSVKSVLAELNIPDAGGAIGYLVMDRLLAKFLSPFGASVLMATLMLFSLVLMIGFRALLASIGNFVGGKPLTPEEQLAAEDRARDEAERVRAAREAREQARASRAAEKQRAAEERAAQKQAKADAKEAARAAREAERNAALVAAEETRNAVYAARQAALAARQAEKAGATFAPQPVAPAPAPETPARAARPQAVPAAKPAPENATEEVPEDRGPYVLPPITLLEPTKPSAADHGDVEGVGAALVATLATFGVKTELAGMVTGPVVTQFKLQLDPTVKVERIPALSGNLQLALAAKSLRIQAPIPGEPYVGVEVPNPVPGGVAFGDIVRSATWRAVTDLSPKNRKKMHVPLCLGKDAAGNDLVADLASMPHLLVAGATGQGKSVCLNSIINGLLMCRTPDQLRLIMVDPKRVEFTSYNRLPHLLVPIVNDTNKVVFALQWAVVEMDKRLKMFGRAGCRNIVDFNTRKMFDQPDLFGEGGPKPGADLPKTIPYIVIVIDEVADIMQTAKKSVEPVIARLTALARATGIHLILATQRPDAKIITGVIKSNIPGRLAFKTSSSIDSRTILDDTGAEDLIGKGDMLFKTKEGILLRAQGSYISDPEINAVTDFIAQHAAVNFDRTFAAKMNRIKEANPEDAMNGMEEEADAEGAAASAGAAAKADDAAGDAQEDKLYARALEVVRLTRRASTSHLQRRMGIGYNHAARLIDKLEENGIIGPSKGAGPRDILVDLDAMTEVGSAIGPHPDALAGDAASDAPSDAVPESAPE